MGPILKSNPDNKESLFEEIIQDVNNNNKNIDIFPVNPAQDNSSYINKKRKKPDGGGDRHPNELNENVPLETFSQLKQKLEENEKKAENIKEEIAKKQKEFDKLTQVIKNQKNELVQLEKYKKIENNLIEYLDKQLLNYKSDINTNNEPNDTIKNMMDDYWNKNQSNLLPLYQNLNQNSKKNLKHEINALEKLYQKTYLQTIVIEKNHFKNEATLILEDKLSPNNNLKEPKLQNKQNINNNININFDQYSFKCLTDNLNYKMMEGTKEVSFRIELENNGEFPWPINETFLLTDKTKSKIQCQKICLDPLNPKAKQFFYIKFKNMDKLSPGIYKNSLVFYAKKKKFGDNITIQIEVYKKN